MSFAEWSFYAYGRDKDSKITRIQSWKQVEKSGGNPEGLRNKPDLPSEGLYLWLMYRDIRKGCENIGYAEIAAYQQVTGDILTHWEVDLMIEIDLARRLSG